MRLLAQGTRRRGARAGAGGRESAVSCRRPFPARTGGSAGPARGSASLRTSGSFSRLVEKRRRSLRSPALERRPNRAEAEPMLGLTQLSNYLTLKGSFSPVSKPNLQENMRLKALAKIYTMHSFAQLCNLNFCQILPKNCKILQQCHSANLANHVGKILALIF